MIVSNHYCTIPVSILITSPFSLVMGDQVYANVIAINSYGSSIISHDGNGAIIMFVPSAPVNLVNNINITSTSQIAFSWSNGASNGGS